MNITFHNSFSTIYIAVILTFISFLTACDTQERLAAQTETDERAAICDSTVVIHIDRCTINEIPLSKLVQSVAYVELETNDSSLLYTPTNIKLTDSLIYVYDIMEQLKRFDRKGHYLGNAYQRGEGPEELINLYDFDVDEEHLYLLEGNRSILFVCTHYGKLIARHQLPFRAVRFKHLPNGEYLFRLAPFTLKERDEEQALLVRTDKDFRPLAHYLTQDHEAEGTRLRTPFFENTYSSCYFAPLYKRSIYTLEGENFYMKYYLDFDTPYYETSRDVDGMSEAKEQGIFFTHNNPIHNDAYLFQPFATSKEQQGLLIIDRNTHKALFARRIENDRNDMLDFNMLSASLTYDELTGSFVGLASYYYENVFKPEDLRRIKELLPDTLEPVLLRKEEEEINPILLFYKTGNQLIP